MKKSETKYKHKTNIQIRFNDIDIAGHVNNAVHLYYYDYGRMQYFNKIFSNTINWKKEGLVLANIDINYINPIFLDDTIFVETKIIKFGNKSLEMHQQITDANNGQIKSESKSILVGYDYETKLSHKIKNDWKKSVINFES